jgi:predicted negative regulator of RcsB-dependent stress response
MKTFGAILVGLLLIAAAAAGWKFWQVDAMIAVIVGGSGIGLITSAFSKDEDDEDSSIDEL